jgi:signal transduction histidine kinase
MDLRGCVSSRPELIKKLIVDLRHHCAIPITIIKQVLHDLEHKGLAPQEGYLQISSCLDELLEIITSQSDDALLAFQAEDETSVLDLCSVIQEAVGHVQTRHQHQARFSPCKLELPSVPIEISTSRVLLHRILEAILDNAYDAIAECAPRSNWNPEVSCCLRIKPVEMGKLVLIEIRDNGDGIAQENVDNIWGTFSTKGAGRGQGLNGKRDELKQLRGTIDVDTKLNEGTRFILKLGKERETD